MIVLLLLPIFTGTMFAHLLWPDRDFKSLAFKFFLGIGIGLGLWSLLYFVFMLLFAGQHWFILVHLLLFLILLSVTFVTERRRGWDFLPNWNLRGLTRTQGALLALGAVVFLVSLTSTASYLLRRRQGDWDAWMMYNRAARFVYRDPVNWLESFSPRMDPIFHPDYPLLLAMNIASAWDTLNSETPHVPMAQSGLFALACAGLLVSALASVKSIGQAALGLIIFWGTPAVVNEGARELADLPLAYFILATGILIYLYVLHRHWGLLVLAGLTAGLAAWTKNEGSVFVIAAGIGLGIAFLREKPWRVLGWYALGLLFPMAVVLFFKLFLAPPSDVLSNGLAKSIHQILDLSRHLEIVRFFWTEFRTFGDWGILPLSIGILPVLVVYYLVFRSGTGVQMRSAYAAGLTMLAVQALGYYAIYLITPYDLTWHLSYSIERIALQVFPLVAFLILTACKTPELIFQAG